MKSQTCQINRIFKKKMRLNNNIKKMKLIIKNFKVLLEVKLNAVHYIFKIKYFINN